MADVAGLGGNITLPSGINIAVFSWSLTHDIDINPVPPAFGSKWETAVHGAGRLTGSAAGKIEYDASSTQPLDLSGTDWSNQAGQLVLTAETGCTYTFNAVFANFAFERQHGDYMGCTFDFRNSDSTVTVAWDETA